MLPHLQRHSVLQVRSVNVNPALKEEDRPHILRNMARAKKFASEMRKVTRSVEEEV